jgi:putative FmdB family regulatory protein
MPVYEYECKECSNRFEKMQPITADPLKECPNCGQNALRRVFHPVGVIFKGSGWYITDNRNSSNNGSKETKETKESDKPASTEKAETKTKSEGSTGESSPGTTPSTSSTDQG